MSDPTMDDVLRYVGQLGDDNAKNCSKAMFHFLYKEILINRIMLLESDPQANRAGIAHTEKIVNDLNRLLMEQLAAAKA